MSLANVPSLDAVSVRTGWPVDTRSDTPSYPLAATPNLTI